jgi:hypothetical protein
MPSGIGEQGYRIPTVLRDLQLVDLLELTGSTTASAAQIGLSQPSVSRRYRALAADLGLQRHPDDPIGKSYGHTPWLQLLRQGINSHRLASGVLRIGGAERAAMGLKGQCGVQWVTLGRRQWQHWHPLLQLELLDAVALQEPPQEVVAGKLPYRVLSGPHGWLACRIDPVVLQLAQNLSLAGTRGNPR